MIAGIQAKQIFERARLPNEVLEQIWNLADSQGRGALGVSEFIIAMHLLTSFKSGAMKVLPTILPPGLVEAASRRPSLRPALNTSSQSQQMSSTPYPSGIPRQFSGQEPPPPKSPIGSQTFSTPPVSAQPTGNDWAIGPRDKAQFDGIFATVDRANKGYITGDDAVRFFSNSRLPSEVLAQIWDLACINANGQLNKEEFAVAMYLIRQQRGARDGINSLPATLPPNLIPPNMRHPVGSLAQPSGPVSGESLPKMSRSATEDLFGLDAFSQPTSVNPQSTGGSSSQTLSKSSPALPQGSGQPAQQSSNFKPFVPSSSFGQTIVASNVTGGSNTSALAQSQSRQQQPSSAMDDLLGDNDPEISKKLTAETTELANLSNQVGSLSKQMQEVKSKRTATVNELSTAKSQKREFETRLAQLRTLYEREVQDVRTLEEQLNSCRNDTKKLLRDIAMIEGTYEDLQNQHRQAVGALKADQKEQASLKERIRNVNNEIESLRPQLEKVKSEARQTKGLVAINKKQLATNESERDKLKDEIEEVSKVAKATSGGVSDVPPPISSPPASSTLASPVSQSANPFFKKASTDPVQSIQSPGSLSPAGQMPSLQHQNTFDDLFGPSYLSQTKSTPPPPTSFRVEPGSTAESGETRSIKSSPASRGIEPPAPPQSRQLTPSVLPFRDALKRGESPSSSVSASVPESRYGAKSDLDPDTEKSQDSPFAELIEHQHDMSDGRKGTSTGDHGSKGPSRSDTHDSDSTAEDSPEATNPSTFEIASKANVSKASGTSNSTGDSMPGSFPGEFHTPMQTPAEERDLPQQQEDNVKPAAISDGIFDATPTGGDPRRSNTTAIDDFEKAFTELGDASRSANKQPNGVAQGTAPTERNFEGPRRIDNEFPPIQELGGDSDTSSEHGFEDDFTADTPQANDATRHEHRNINAGVDNTRAMEFPFNSNNFPAKSADAIPSREDSAPSQPSQVSKPAVPPSGSQTNQEGSTISAGVPPGAANMFSSPAANSSRPGNNDTLSAPQKPQSSTATSDNEFDDDFADLADATEPDSKPQAGVAQPLQKPDDFDEFSHVFHSSAGPSLDDNAGQRSMTASSGQLGENPSDSWSQLGESAQSPSETKPGQSANASSSHDWDAIFAGLDSETNGTPGAPPQSVPLPKDTPETEVGAGQASSSSKPPLERTGTADSTNDDPILKRLTGMGYPRGASLRALEKFDYNIDKVNLQGFVFVAGRDSLTVQQAADYLIQNVSR